MNHLRTPLVLLAAILALTACGSDGGAGPLFGTDAAGSTVTVPGDSGTTVAEALEPLPIREGLGTFDNYVWHMRLDSIGPTASETSGNTVELSFNRDAESSSTRTTATQTGPDIEGVEESVTERYVVAGEVCQWDGDEWTHTLATDQQQEVLDVVERLFDVVIVPESPVVIGSDTIAGIPATHYRFSVSGFGAESGALITANQMDYWLADGTGVVVKYQMVIESRSGPTTDPEAEVYRIEASAELLSANVFVPVELSPDCLAIPPEDA
jgi:predicted small lipoprotein YifL